MKKSIKPCINNVIIALRACANAHHAPLEDWTDEGQVGIENESIPVFADVKAILEAFYKPDLALPVLGYGYVTAYVYDEWIDEESGESENPFLDKVDETKLLMALPYKVKVDWEME